MHPHDDVGLWAQFRDGTGSAGRPALFLDRDGVVVDEVHFLRRVEDVRLMPGMAAAIAAANAAAVPVIVVTNQSGIARSHFAWADFAAVQTEIADQLAVQGAWCDAVLACGHLEGGRPPFDKDTRQWRKPGPGMLFAARDRLGVDLARSAMVGDRVSDLEAGRNAGLSAGHLVLTGYGSRHVDALEAVRCAWAADGFTVAVWADPAAAVHAAIERLARADTTRG